MGRLLGCHPDYAVIPFEAKFHADPRGLSAVIAGRISATEFNAGLLAGYDTSPRRRGLARAIEASDLEQALEDFRRAAEVDVLAAARLLLQTVFGGYAHSRRKCGWIEMTPRNLLHAPELHSLFPEARFVNIVRDGRDVAASLLKIPWKTDPIDALNWWEARMHQAEAAVGRVPPEAVHRLSFENLMVTEREQTLVSLLGFLGWESEPKKVRRFFDEEMSAVRAHVGRWSSDLPESQRQEVDRRYQEILSRFRSEGITLP
jgi:hypothetical protein